MYWKNHYSDSKKKESDLCWPCFKEVIRREEGYLDSDGVSNSFRIVMIQRETNFFLRLDNCSVKTDGNCLKQML